MTEETPINNHSSDETTIRAADVTISNSPSDIKKPVKQNTSDTTSAEDNNQIVIGNVYEGTVTNITNFGVFVKLPNNEEGLVHISELANEFVTDINQYVSLGEQVSVKVLGRNNKNKLDFSMKQAIASDAPQTEPQKPDLFLYNKSKNPNFEDKLGQFLKKSEEKQIDIRRNLKQKQGIVKKRR